MTVQGETNKSHNLLEIQDFSLSFSTLQGKVRVVRNLSLTVKKNEIFAIIGESGCGKSATAKSINRILPKHSSHVDSGKILLHGVNLLDFSEKEMEGIRGNKISMIFQEPMTSLNPSFTIGHQIAEVFRTHHNIGKKEAKEKTIELLRKVHIPSPENRVNHYPHQLSGGMQQRAMIAMAFASPNPSLLVADEPTTALDVTIQAQILALLQELRDSMGLSILLITHDMGLVAQYADRVAVMYCGKIVEEGTVAQLFEKPSHPYTLGLLKSMPHINIEKKQDTHRLVPIDGTVPDLRTLGDGCPFYSRCNYSTDACMSSFPKERIIAHSTKEENQHITFCHNLDSVKEASNNKGV